MPTVTGTVAPIDLGVEPEGASVGVDQARQQTPESELADEQLMIAYARGHGGAFEILYDRHRGPMYRYLLRSVNDAGVAEELFQDVWMRLIDARRRYQVTARFQTYLYRIARNRVIDHYRASRPTESLDQADTLDRISDPEQVGAGRLMDEQATEQVLRQAIAELPLEQRTAFLLQAERGMSLEQIGEVTGVGRETVKSRLRYATDKIRDALRQHHGI